jgi:hypothetical protein
MASESGQRRRGPAHHPRLVSPSGWTIAGRARSWAIQAKSRAGLGRSVPSVLPQLVAWPVVTSVPFAGSMLARTPQLNLINIAFAPQSAGRPYGSLTVPTCVRNGYDNVDAVLMYNLVNFSAGGLACDRSPDKRATPLSQNGHGLERLFYIMSCALHC